MKKTIPGALAFALMISLGCARAQAPAGDEPAGDAKAGETLASQGAPANGVVACATCHGAQGEGNAAGGFPRLAGLPEAYLRKQLEDYVNDTRRNPVMQPIAKAMNEEQRRDAAAYYAGLGAGEAAAGAQPAAPAAAPAAPAPAEPAKPAGDGKPDGDAAAAGERPRGEVLATIGDESIQVQACVNCHGPGNAGSAPIYPYLAGQHASYLVGALTEFRNGERTNDTSGQMPTIAQRLSEADIQAVADYLASLPPPSADAAATADYEAIRQRAAEGAASAQPSGDDKPAPAGVGTEQGSPTTGGGQGPGGGGGGSGAGPSGSESGAGTVQEGQGQGRTEGGARGGS